MSITGRSETKTSVRTVSCCSQKHDADGHKGHGDLCRAVISAEGQNRGILFHTSRYSMCVRDKQLKKLV